MPIELTCKRCHHKWTYRGKSQWYTSCPICKTSVSVRVKKAKPKPKPEEG